MKGLRVFIASALGAGVGSLIALQLAGFWWWVGLIVGAIIGFLSYEYQEIWSAVKKSWNSTISWRPNASHLRIRFARSICFIIVVGLNVSLLFWLLVLTMGDFSHDILFLLVATLSMTSFMGFLAFSAEVKDKTQEDIQKELTFLKTVTRLGNPATIIFYWIPKFGYIILKELYSLIQEIPSAIMKIIKEIPVIITMFLKFIVTIFAFLYSDVRLLCAINAAVGTFIGYLYGNVIIGASVGGTLGVLGYYVPPLLSPKFVHSHE